MKWILMAFVIYLLSYGVYYLVTWSDKPGRKVTKSHNRDYDSIFDSDCDGGD